MSKKRIGRVITPKITEPSSLLEPWVKPYLPLLINTGGNEAGELLDDLSKDKGGSLIQTNLVRFMLAVSVESQLCFLHRLRKAGLLKES